MAAAKRLDFFIISNELLPFVKDANILPGYRTDHSIVTLEINLTKIHKKCSYWKFNASLLQDTLYVNKVKDIKTTIEAYAAFPYNMSNIDLIPTADLQLRISDPLFLDVLLMNIRGMTISYASWKKKTTD